MASPLRFRVDHSQWSEHRIREELLDPLEESFGASLEAPRYSIGPEWTGYRFRIHNGDRALFVTHDEESVAYWVGNTETPAALWRTDKHGWEEIPFDVARWARRELLADLYEADPWLAEFEYLTWFFLPVLMSKDGRRTTRRFFREDAAGFPEADWREGVEFYDSFLSTGVLEPYRETMAGKLGTSQQYDRTRMRAAMGEFTVAKLLFGTGLDPVPEVDVDSGHAIDFRTNGGRLVEVTRPQSPRDREVVTTGINAVTESARAKTTGQLEEHQQAVLFVDCTNFLDDEWAPVRAERPQTAHQPAVVFRARPSGHVEGYTVGTVPFDLGESITVLG